MSDNDRPQMLPTDSSFDRRINEIIDRNLQRPNDDPAKSDINFLLAWLASCKGQAEGYRQAIDDIKQWKEKGLT